MNVGYWRRCRSYFLKLLPFDNLTQRRETPQHVGRPLTERGPPAPEAVYSISPSHKAGTALPALPGESMAHAPFASDGYKFAINPLQWMATPDGWIDPTKAPAPALFLAEVAKSGARAVHAQVPPGWTVAEYKAALEANDLLPAPGYFSMPLPDQGVGVAEMLELARVASGQQAALGLQDMFIACRMTKDSPRIVRPAIGAEPDKARTNLVVDLLGQAAEVMNAEGVRPALHPHVGTWVETEHETRHILDALDSDILNFGPDTGHLHWAGADVHGLIRDYRDRIRALHVKDCVTRVRDRSIASQATYQQTAMAGLWAEPGRGDLDLVGMLAELGPDFSGWLVVEVDYPTMAPFESAQVGNRWMAELRRPN